MCLPSFDRPEAQTWNKNVCIQDFPCHCPSKLYWLISSHRRVSEMEAKIDGLVTLLKSTQQPLLNNEPLGFAPDPGATNVPHAPPTPSPTDSPCPPCPPTHLGDHESPLSLAPMLVREGSSSIEAAKSNAQGITEPHPLFGNGPSPEVAEVLLNRFRQMILYFPFMVLAASTSARDLFQHRPFLYHCIMAVSCRSPSQQIAFGNEMMRYLGEHMLVKGENSLDLLLGILTYAGWFVTLYPSLSSTGPSPWSVQVKFTDVIPDYAGTILMVLSPRSCAFYCNSPLLWCST